MEHRQDRAAECALVRRADDVHRHVGEADHHAEEGEAGDRRPEVFEHAGDEADHDEHAAGHWERDARDDDGPEAPEQPRRAAEPEQ